MQIIKLPGGAFEYDPAIPLGKPGGFGQVFAGKSARHGEVAVKKLRLSAADSAHRELRIADELKGRSLQHVVPFIDAGEDADTGDYFVVMPSAKGNLQNWVEAVGVLTAEKAAPVLLQITKGLIEVGDLVHRDLKPDNVLLHEGDWKVADFGIARFVEEVTSGNTLKDCLSPFYAAPEQWRSERATHATDIYALGCIGFFLLMGKPPFAGDLKTEHSTAPVPPFDCIDQRLRVLILNSLRKLPETRPSLARAQSLLSECVARPVVIASGDPDSLFAHSAARLVDHIQQDDAAKQQALRKQQARVELSKSGKDLLKANLERFWEKFHQFVPDAKRIKVFVRDSGENSPHQSDVGWDFLGEKLFEEIKPSDKGKGRESFFACHIERAAIVVNFLDRDLGGTPFPEADWDSVAGSMVLFQQLSPRLECTSFLWYGKDPRSPEYRWWEILYLQPLPPPRRPDDFFADAFRPARVWPDCLWESKALMRVAFGPRAIDDENEADFHSRWMWILERAYRGELKQWGQTVFRWPPPRSE